jgi:hypothetical protein
LTVRPNPTPEGPAAAGNAAGPLHLHRSALAGSERWPGSRSGGARGVRSKPRPRFLLGALAFAASVTLLIPSVPDPGLLEVILRWLS